jgi:hypothetical protein
MRPLCFAQARHSRIRRPNLMDCRSGTATKPSNLVAAPDLPIEPIADDVITQLLTGRLSRE